MVGKIRELSRDEEAHAQFAGDLGIDMGRAFASRGEVEGRLRASPG